MLLGCCHCGQDVSESQSASASASASADAPPTTTGCGNCIGGVAPLRYKLSVSSTSTNLCAQNYMGDFILSLDQVGATCFWKSAEKPLIRLGLPGDCLEYTGCTINAWRWQISLETLASGINIRGRAHFWNGSGCVPYINLVGLQDTAATDRNCLVGTTLTGTLGGVSVTGVLTVAP